MTDIGLTSAATLILYTGLYKYKSAGITMCLKYQKLKILITDSRVYHYLYY